MTEATGNSFSTQDAKLIAAAANDGRFSDFRRADGSTGQ
jgi:hypothetical protein